MGYTEKISSTFRKRENSLRQHTSVFEQNTPLEDHHRVVLAVSSTCFLLLLATAIILFVTPYSNSHDPSATKSAVTTSQCNIEVTQNTCKVTCLNISWEYGEHPGHVAAQFLADNRLVYEDNCTTWELLMSTCVFPDNHLDAEWLSGTEDELPVISALEINNCGALNSIAMNVFSTSPALDDNLLRLAIANNDHLREMRAGIFNGLDALQALEWRGNAILHRVDVGALASVKNVVQVLQVTGGVANASVMANLVGKCQGRSSYHFLLALDMSYSPSFGLERLGKDLFSALRNVEALYLHGSTVREFEDNKVFNSIKGSLKSIHLNNNKLSTLPNGTFTGFTNNLTLYLESNNWNCDCHLQWLQDLLTNENSHVQLGENWDGKKDNPVCASPESELNKSILHANMSTCNAHEPVEPIEVSCEDATSTTNSDPETTTTAMVPTELVQCYTWKEERDMESLFTPSIDESSANLVFPTRLPEFHVFEVIDDGRAEKTTVQVETGILSEDKHSIRKTLVFSSITESKCYKHVYGTGFIPADRNTSYTFCMLDEGDNVAIPTHCLALTTKPFWSDRSWITNSVKKIVIPILILLLVFCILLGAVSVVVMFRSRPALLKKVSDRVEVVHTSRHDAIVMPTTTSTKVTVESRDSYDRRNSESSNDPSYVSLTPPSSISLFVFRFREWLRRVNSGEHSELQPQSDVTSSSTGDAAPPPVPTNAFTISRL